MESQWFQHHTGLLAADFLVVDFRVFAAYTIAKYGMSMCVLGMADELAADSIGVCALWPRSSIDTDAARITRPTADAARTSRTPAIMADAAYVLLQQPRATSTGRFLIDEDVLATAGVHDLRSYAVDPSLWARGSRCADNRRARFSAATLRTSFFVPNVKYTPLAKL